jgi:periplasmic mercuric ion binding protein
MKTNILVALLLVGISSSVIAQSKKSVKANFKVYGNCGMCKARIETALDRTGIKMASWDSKTKMLDVVYNSKKITEQQIHEIIAAVGHDTDKAKANTDVYAKLPFCCLYRDHDHSGVKGENDSHTGHY